MDGSTLDIHAEQTLADLAASYDVDEAAPLLDACGDPVYVVPSAWTAAHVLFRLENAYGVIQRSVSKPGPKAFGNSWPAILVEFWDMIDETARKRAVAEKERDARRGGKPTSNEIAMADEAIHWPMRFLRGDAHEVTADSLRLWLLALTENFNLDRALSRRRLTADAIIDMLRGGKGSPEIVDEDRVRVAARSIAGAANVQLAEAREKARAARSDRQLAAARVDAAYARRRARERFADLVNREQLLRRLPTVKIARAEVMPGKVFWRQTLDKKRWEAASMIADELRRAGVAVR